MFSSASAILISILLLLVLHKLEVFVKLRWMGTTGPTHIKPLTDERAAELGAEIIGDTFVYSVAASIIIFEYYRSRKNEQDAEDTQNSQIAKLNDSIKSLEKEMKDIKNSLNDMNSETTSKLSKDSKVENKS